MDIKDQHSTTHIESQDEKRLGDDAPHEPAVALKSTYDELGLGKTALLFKKACAVCILLCIAAAADGYQISLNGNIIANTGFIQKIGHLTDKGTYILPGNAVAIWGALQSLGQLIGMIFFNPVSDRVGRKMTLYLLWLVLFGSIMIESFVRNWQDWAGAKLLAGIGVGCIQATLPIYITEWSPVNIRGAMLLAYSVWNNIGNFIAPLILNFLQKARPLDYKTAILTQWAFLGIMLPIFVWLPETASYFAARDQDDKGRATLRRINGHIEGYDVDAEYAIVKNTILEERAIKASMGLEGGGFKDVITSYLECLKGVNLRRTIGSTLPITAQQLTGLAFLNTYASLFFKQSGFTNAFEITTIITAIKIFMILALVFTTDRFGRRNIVIALTALCTAMMMLVGILGLLEKTPANKIGLIVIACIWSMGSAGQGALGWTFVGEVASQKLRARTAGLAAAFSVLFGLTFNTSVPIMLDVTRADWGYKTAWLFFATGLVTTVLTFLYVPETAKRNSAEMDEMYEKGVPAWRMRNFVTEAQQKREMGI